MKVKLIYESTDCWTQTKVVEVQDFVSEEDVQALFQVELDVPYNKYECTYEVIGDGHVFTTAEVLSYTD